MTCKDKNDGRLLAEWSDENNRPSPYEIEKIWPDGRIAYEIRHYKPELTDQEREIAAYHAKPAHPDTIMKYLLKLAGHKHLKGDERQKRFLLKEFMSELTGATELQLFFANYFFITESEDGFFPQLSTYKKRVFIK